MRETLLLVVVGELTHQEAADLLKIPLGTVLSRVSRARQRLRDAPFGPKQSLRERRATGEGLSVSSCCRGRPVARDGNADRRSVASVVCRIPITNSIRAMDAELRAVPLPDGFLERLRPSVLTDEELDCARAGRASARWFGRPVATVARAITLAGEELGLCEAGQPMGGGPVAVGRPGGGTGRHPGGILAVREASGAAGGFCGQCRCGPRAGERRRGIGRSPSRYAGYARTAPGGRDRGHSVAANAHDAVQPKAAALPLVDRRGGREIRVPEPRSTFGHLALSLGRGVCVAPAFRRVARVEEGPGVDRTRHRMAVGGRGQQRVSDSLRRTPVCLAGVESATAEHRGSAGG